MKVERRASETLLGVYVSGGPILPECGVWSIRSGLPGASGGNSGLRPVKAPVPDPLQPASTTGHTGRKVKMLMISRDPETITGLADVVAT